MDNQRNTATNELKVIGLEQNGNEFILTSEFNGKIFTHPIEIEGDDEDTWVSLPDELNIILLKECPQSENQFNYKILQLYNLYRMAQENQKLGLY